MTSLINESSEMHSTSLRFLILRVLVVLMLGVVMLISAELLCRVGVSLAQPSESHLREFDHKWALAHARPPKSLPAILFLGDSYTSRAIYPELLMSELKAKGLSLTALNLGSTSNTPRMSLALLKEAISSGWRPNLVVYGLSPRLFNRSYIQNSVANGQAQFDESFIGRCKANKPSGWQKQRCQLEKGFFLLRYRKYWAERLRQLPDMLSHTNQYMQDGGVNKAVHEISPHGWSPGYVVYTEPEYQDLMSITGANGQHNLDTAKMLFGNFQWDERPFQELQAYCEKLHIPLLLVWYPENPVRGDYYKACHLSREMFSDRFAGLSRPGKSWFMDLHAQDADATHFYNTDHLNVLGTTALTLKMAEYFTKSPFKEVLVSRPSMIYSKGQRL